MSNYWQKRKSKLLEENHVDDWLMTYADMITLLLCFFCIFIAISVPEAEKFENAKRKMMETFAGATSDRLKGEYALPPTEIDSPPQAPIPYEALPSIVDRYHGKDMDVEKDGDRITRIEMNSAPFFDKGAASLNADGLAMLESLIPTLKDPQYDDYMISVEGHTDDTPINTPLFPSNWELSTARAAAVVRFLTDQGVPASKLRAIGYGEGSPKVPNRDAANIPLPDNQALNRRVVIRLEKIEPAK
jgi:chemotaxis protein MotB